MKKVLGMIISLIITISAIIIGFEVYYKDSVNSFITDKSTIIYHNKKLDEEIVSFIREKFRIDNENEILYNIKEVCFVSQNIIYKEKLDGVLIVDLGKYYPMAILKLNNFFHKVENEFYVLKDKKKKEIDKILNIKDDIYLKNYKGLFVLGTSEETIEKAIKNTSRKSTEIEKILENKNNYKLGNLIVNQERERYLGIDRIVLSGNLDDNSIKIDGEIIGDNSIIDDFRKQPEKRFIDKYIGENTCYFSTANIENIDTFILRALSLKIDNENIANLLQNFLVIGFSDLFSQLNGEMLIDITGENYIFGMKKLENIDRVKATFENIEEISIEKDEEENYYLIIGKNVFKKKNIKKEMKDNKILEGNFTFKNKYMKKINISFYAFEKSIKIKSEIILEK